MYTVACLPLGSDRLAADACLMLLRRVHGRNACSVAVSWEENWRANRRSLSHRKVIALEMAEHNITCNAICPAYVRTPLVEKQIQNQAREHGIPAQDVVRKIMLERPAIRCLLEPEEIASLGLYLCSDVAAPPQILPALPWTSIWAGRPAMALENSRNALV